MIETVLLTLLALGFLCMGALCLWWVILPVRTDFSADDFELLEQLREQLDREGRGGDAAERR